MPTQEKKGDPYQAMSISLVHVNLRNWTLRPEAGSFPTSSVPRNFWACRRWASWSSSRVLDGFKQPTGCKPQQWSKAAQKHPDGEHTLPVDQASGGRVQLRELRVSKAGWAGCISQKFANKLCKICKQDWWPGNMVFSLRLGACNLVGRIGNATPPPCVPPPPTCAPPPRPPVSHCRRWHMSWQMILLCPWNLCVLRFFGEAGRASQDGVWVSGNPKGSDCAIWMAKWIRMSWGLRSKLRIKSCPRVPKILS